MTSVNDKLAVDFKRYMDEENRQLTFADLANMSLKQAWEQLKYVLSFSNHPKLLLKRMKTRGLRFKDCTVAEVEESILQPGKWGLTTGLYNTLNRNGVFSMILIQQCTDDELLELRGMGWKMLREIREVQRNYEQSKQ